MFSSLLLGLFVSFMNPIPYVDQAATPALKAAVASENRPEADRNRDALRKPAEVLQFFGIQPGMTVVDFAAGTGYYTHILSNAVGPKGKVTAHNPALVIERFVKDKLKNRVANHNLKNVNLLVSEFDEPNLPGDLDAVVMVLFYHDTYWQKVDRPKMNKAIYDALKPGAVFGIVDHSAEPGSGDRDVKSLHRVDAEWVKKEIVAAGFIFEGESNLLRHPEDTRNWPFFKDISTTRDRTDRFIYLFRKPN